MFHRVADMTSRRRLRSSTSHRLEVNHNNNNNIMIIRNLYSAIMPLGGYTGAGWTGKLEYLAESSKNRWVLSLDLKVESRSLTQQVAVSSKSEVRQCWMIVWQSADRSPLYSRWAGVSGFWCHRLERPASLRRICAVTHGFQTTTRDLSVFSFLPRHYHMTHVLLSPFITTVWKPLFLAIIDII